MVDKVQRRIALRKPVVVLYTTLWNKCFPVLLMEEAGDYIILICFKILYCGLLGFVNIYMLQTDGARSYPSTNLHGFITYMFTIYTIGLSISTETSELALYRSE
jgi:hypothetical protein